MTQENSILKFVYTFFLGILVALFVGLGVNTFYPGPTEPEYPTTSQAVTKEPTAEQQAAENKYQADYRAYEKKLKPYSRNVSIITLTAAVIFLVLSLVFESHLRILADGILFGGLFTLLYSIIRGFISQESKYVFMVVTIGLAAVMYIGYHRFVRRPASLDSSK